MLFLKYLEKKDIKNKNNIFNLEKLKGLANKESNADYKPEKEQFNIKYDQEKKENSKQRFGNFFNQIKTKAENRRKNLQELLLVKTSRS